jgi:glutamate/tyrosine decarboxylase-like PLP-dependent enzyme
MKSSALQEKMFAELNDQSLFQKAESFGLDYLSKVLDRHVYPTEETLQNLSVFEEKIPLQTSNAHEVLDLLNTYGSPATVAQIGGRYFGFVNGSVIPAGLAAKNLSIFWDQNTAMQVISPISSKLESVVQNWLIELFGLPETTVAGFVSGTSMANFCGLAAARYRMLKNKGWDITEQGLFNAPKIRVVTSRHAHSTILKAISLLGFGKGNIEWVDVDDQGRIIPERIPELDDSTILILQAGNVNSGAFDPFEFICKKAKEKGAWIHIDGAFGLWAGATQSLNHLTTGYELADSWAVDGHKTLNTPYDSGIIMCSDSRALTAALHMSGGYIIKGKDRDGMYYTPEMSRRARIIELWATLKYLGKQGVEELISGLHERAQQFAEQISSLDGFIVLNEVVFNQIMVQCATDEKTEQVIQNVQKSRACWVGGSTWESRRIIRVSVCSWTTTEEDIRLAVASFREAIST